MKLSRNFSLSEFQVSETAARHDIDMTLDNPIFLANVKKLAHTILQPLRDSYIGDVPGKVFPIIISSGYRPAELNKLIKGSKGSDHLDASAADINVIEHTPMEVAERVLELKLPFGQLILEFPNTPRCWVHISLGDKREVMTAFRKRQKTIYVFGLYKEPDKSWL